MHNMLEAGKVMNCTMMALHKMQAENASWQIFFFQHHRSEAHTRRTWKAQRGWWWWDKIMGASIFVEEKLVEAAAAAAATAGVTLHAVCCTQSFYPLLWGGKLTQQMAFAMSKHVETALGVLVQVLLLAGWLAGWLASVKKQQNPTDSNHCASDTESVWSSGVTSNSWEHFLSSCQLQTQTSRWVQEEEHRKHKRASHVPDRCGRQQQQDESSLNSTLLAACLSMAWIWFPSRPSPPHNPPSPHLAANVTKSRLLTPQINESACYNLSLYLTHTYLLSSPTSFTHIGSHAAFAPLALCLLCFAIVHTHMKLDEKTDTILYI